LFLEFSFHLSAVYGKRWVPPRPGICTRLLVIVTHLYEPHVFNHVFESIKVDSCPKPLNKPKDAASCAELTPSFDATCSDQVSVCYSYVLLHGQPITSSAGTEVDETPRNIGANKATGYESLFAEGDGEVAQPSLEEA
jgi:hypothetical protein